jgi:O-antigen/teichoic acid export membrane protein
MRVKYLSTLAVQLFRSVQGVLVTILIAREYDAIIRANFLFYTSVYAIYFRMFRSNVDSYFYTTFTSERDMRLSQFFIGYITCLGIIAIMPLIMLAGQFGDKFLFVGLCGLYVFFFEILSLSIQYLYDSDNRNIQGNIWIMLAIVINFLALILAIYAFEFDFLLTISISLIFSSFIFISAIYAYFRSNKLYKLLEVARYAQTKKAEISRFILPLLPIVLLGEASKLWDQLLVRSEFQDADIIILGIGLRLVTLVTLLPTNYIRIYWREIVDIKKHLQFKFLTVTLIFYILVGGFLTFVLSIFIDQLISTLYGNKYTENSTVYILFLIVGIISSCNQLLSTHLLSMSRTRILGFIRVPLELLSLIIAYLFIVHLDLGVIGVELRLIIIGTASFCGTFYWIYRYRS